MKWKKFANQSSVKISEIPVLPLETLCSELALQIREDDDRRAISFFTAKTGDAERLYAVFCDDSTSQLFAASAEITEGGREYASMTPDVPAMHMFERELFEETFIRPVGHPWLKPVRFGVGRTDLSQTMENYPFYSMAGDQVHEVAVGPVHAGVIEPGHFRFMCHGETVHHLEIQLGYQHRNIEALMLQSLSRKKDALRYRPHLAEKIAGDTAIGHGLAFAGLIETLAGTDTPPRAQTIRSIALELERAAMHIGDLGALLNDVGFTMGSAVFGALRTVVINASLSICGSRFGMGLVTAGGVHFDIAPDLARELGKKMQTVEKKLADLMNLTVMNQPSVLTRLESTGTVDTATAASIGMVGPAARASGIPVDVRVNHPFGNYRRSPVRIFTMEHGDVFSRTYIRYVEAMHSLSYIREQLQALDDGALRTEVSPDLPPDTLAVSMVEGWRGEIVHAALTDSKGEIVRYKVKDPSFHNWYGLALAVRSNGVSDFPLCNKSFNLSYCGHDL